MRSKTPLALMEQVIMVLVFALAAAMCLRAFYLSDRISRQCEEKDQAILAVQTVAEILKNCRGDMEETKRRLGTTLDNVDLVIYRSSQNAPPSDGICVAILPLPDDKALLGRAEVTAYDSKGEPIVSLTVAWQEVSGNG